MIANFDSLCASGDASEVVFEGNEKDIGKHIFSRTLKVIPQNDFQDQYCVLSSFRAHIQNFLNGQKFDAEKMKAQFENVKGALSLIGHSSEEGTRTSRIIHSLSSLKGPKEFLVIAAPSSAKLTAA